MKDSNCFYCTGEKPLDDLMLKVCDLPYATVYFMRDQKNPGRCVAAYNRGHVRELHLLGEEERNGYIADVCRVAAAVSRLYHPDKLNYAIYGDKVSHLHIHMVPKTEGGPSWGEPFSDKLPKALLKDGEYAAQIEKLRAEIENI